MQDLFKRLLEVESRAEALVDAAQAERDRLIEEAREEARALETRFEARLPELRAGFQEKAEMRARQAIAELERRNHERQAELRRLAALHGDAAVAAALALLTDARQAP